MTKTATYVSIHRFILLGLLTVLGIAICTYISFTVATIFATAGRTSATHEANRLVGAIGELERTYISLEGTITLQAAEGAGFTSPKKISIETLHTNPTLSLKTE